MAGVPPSRSSSRQRRAKAGRGEGIRTLDFQLPKLTRYQAAPHPVSQWINSLAVFGRSGNAVISVGVQQKQCMGRR